jgi:hypothetical protein
MKQYANPHQPGCPWYDITEQVGAPNISWCEPMRCSLVTAPANTWSNLGYIIVALFFWWQVRARALRDRAVTAFGPTALAMGLFSLIYHASNNYVTQMFDFIGMYLYVYLMLVINIRRLTGMARRPGRLLYWALVVATTGITHLSYVLGFKFQLLIVFIVVAIVATEIVYSRQSDKQKFQYRDFVLAIIFICVGESFSLLDVNRVWCQPENLFLHGHAIWHLLGSVSIYFSYRHYRQIPLT